MKILVTGAAGRVGTKLIDQLLELDHDVCGFDILKTERSNANYTGFTGSLQDANAVASVVQKVAVVFHLGAMMSWEPKDRASSGEVYPENLPLELPITEAHPLQPNSPYGLTKLLGEQLVQFHQRAGSMATVILRFSHTQDATELLDETSFFSGPRFFLQPRIEQQEKFGNQANADLLRSLDPGTPAHVLARNESGRPFQMHITDTRDMVAGLLLALDHPDAIGGTFNLGASEPVDFADLLDKMSRITGYLIVPVDFPGPGVFYHTSNEHIRKTLQYQPQWSIDRMLEEASIVWAS